MGRLDPHNMRISTLCRKTQWEATLEYRLRAG